MFSLLPPVPVLAAQCPEPEHSGHCAAAPNCQLASGSADETVSARVPETYQWLLVPGQPDPKGNVEWTEIRLQGQDALAARAAKKLRNEELLMVQLGGTRLRHELDRIPLWRGDFVGIKRKG